MRNEIRALTGVRGAAALYVVAYHTTFDGGLGPPLVRRFLGHGYLAVDLFFILSGFVMAMTYAHRFRNGRARATYGSFIARRIARLYPLYIVLTLVCAAVAYAGCNAQWPGWRPELLHLGINASLLQALHGGLSIDLPAWSISTEMVAYLLFPLLCTAVLFGSTHRAVAVGAICVLTLAVLAAIPSGWLPPGHRDAKLAWLDLSDGRTFYPILRCLADFTLGLLTWRVSTHRPGQWLRRQTWTANILAAVLVVMLCFRNDDVATAILFAPFILCLATDASLVTRLLGSRVPESLGLISYSVYLVHAPVADMLETALAHLAPTHLAPAHLAPTFLVPTFLTPAHMAPAHLPGGRLPITLLDIAATLAVATLTYRLLEKPGRGAMQAAFEHLARACRPRRPALPAAAIPAD